MKKVLFVCTGNTCRSPVAEKIFNKLCKERNLSYTAKSAGICTISGLPMSEYSMKALDELGIEDLDFTSTSIDELMLSEFDYFCVMSMDHASVLENLFNIPRGKILLFDVSDPYGGSMERYRQCTEEILKKTEDFIMFLGEKNGDN